MVAEFAMLCPLLCVLVVGMLEMGRAMKVSVVLNDAARKGCQTGIRKGKANADISTDVTNIMQDNGFDSTLFSPPSLGSISITVTAPDGTSVADALNAPAGSMVAVQVAIPVTSTMWIMSYFVNPGASQSETVVMQKQ
jgi:Flp pilus assembly protein TadG